MSNVSAKLGPYALTECLESGSSVQLWLGAFKDEQVAIRLVVDPTDDFAVSRWRKELEALQSIGERTSLPKILAVFEDEKAFVFEWKGSESLEERIIEALEGKPCSLEEAVALGLSVLEALREVGEVHGALSPRQVRIHENSRVTLYGYGTKPERVQPRYMAPEMSGEGEIGLHTDQWHTAVMIYELALGRPFYQGDWSEALRQALDGDSAKAIAVLSSRAPSLAPALLPALRDSGAMGYASHAEMGLALQGCLMAEEAMSDAAAPIVQEEEDELEQNGGLGNAEQK